MRGYCVRLLRGCIERMCLRENVYRQCIVVVSLPLERPETGSLTTIAMVMRPKVPRACIQQWEGVKGVGKGCRREGGRACMQQSEGVLKRCIEKVC